MTGPQAAKSERRFHFVAAATDAGPRLDTWLDARLPDFSRSRIQALITDGAVTVNGQPVKPHLKVRDGAVVEIRIPPLRDTSLEPEALPLDILHEDEAIIVINKAPGVVVHPAAGHASGTLVNALLHHRPDILGIGGEKRPGIVHRLDRDTSGVLVVACNDQAMRHLQSQFKSRKTRKHYTTIVRGVPTLSSHTIRTQIRRSPNNRKKMATCRDGGREAITHYKLMQSFEVASQLDVRIETGRTHQIRVHMAHIGHPVVGDKVYGRTPLPYDIPRQMLHAASLTLTHPDTEESITFQAPLPLDMQTLLDQLRG